MDWSSGRDLFILSLVADLWAESCARTITPSSLSPRKGQNVKSFIFAFSVIVMSPLIWTTLSAGRLSKWPFFRLFSAVPDEIFGSHFCDYCRNESDYNQDRLVSWLFEILSPCFGKKLKQARGLAKRAMNGSALFLKFFQDSEIRLYYIKRPFTFEIDIFSFSLTIKCSPFTKYFRTCY